MKVKKLLLAQAVKKFYKKVQWLTLTKMVKFSKSVKCPASEDLLKFQNNILDNKESEKVKKHLVVCEFCSSEVDLYMHFPQNEFRLNTEAIPQPLLELAEALLGNKHKDFRFLNKLLCEKDGLTLKQA